jgi:hypothetical protein
MYRHEQVPPTLPGFGTFLAAAQQGEVPTVLRPHRDYSGLQPTQRAYHGQPLPAQYSSGHFHQGQSAAYHGQAHASIERTTPSASFSSPRSAYNDTVYDTSSVSSSSRESSAYPLGSASSASAQKVTRNKRGSESQGSGSDRSTKRKSTRSGSDGPKDEMWCTICKCRADDCTNRKQHLPKTKKVVKEQSSRSAQAAVLQNLEDYAQICLKYNGGDKKQQPGNKKKSGLTVDKKQGLSLTEIIVDETIQTMIGYGPQAFNDFRERVCLRHQANDKFEGLVHGSILAKESGEESCHHINCGTSIECRKEVRTSAFNENFPRIMGPRLNGGSRRLSAASDSRSKSSTPRRH